MKKSIGNVSVHRFRGMIKRNEEEVRTINKGTLNLGADSHGIGGTAWMTLCKTGRMVDVIGYADDLVIKGRPIVSAITATDLPDGETVLL